MNLTLICLPFFELSKILDLKFFSWTLKVSVNPIWMQQFDGLNLIGSIQLGQCGRSKMIGSIWLDQLHLIDVINISIISIKSNFAPAHLMSRICCINKRLHPIIYYYWTFIRAYSLQLDKRTNQVSDTNVYSKIHYEFEIWRIKDFQ